VHEPPKYIHVALLVGFLYAREDATTTTTTTTTTTDAHGQQKSIDPGSALQ
jgi:hypothetical protein